MSRLRTGSRALVVGLDGATLDVIEPLVRRGRLPTLGRLMREGTSARMMSTTPAMTLPAWSSFLTGSDPGTHGIFDFAHRVPGTYRLEFTNSSHRAVPSMHRLLSQRGARVASIAVPTTYPPEPVDGVMISGFDSPVALGIDRRFVHPPALWPELVDRFGGMRFADFQELHTGEPGWHDRALDSLLAEVPRKEGIASWLLGRERWELLMVLFGETDTVAHHFWAFHDPTSPRHPADASPRLGDAIAQVYEACDAALGRLLDQAAPELVVIASDHGFGAAGTGVLYLNRFLEEKGWLRYRTDGEPVSGHRTGRGLVDRAKGALLARLPGEAQERLVRALPASLLARVESESRYGDIDFAHTSAWSDEMNYAATIHLNVRGRDPRGTISDRDAAIRDLERDLLAWEVDGQRVVNRVHRREQLYTGACVERAPDLVLDLNLDGRSTWTLLPSARVAKGTTSRRLAPHELLGGKGLGMNGSHRPEGTLVLWGKDIAPRRRIDARLVDVLPTMLAALGEPIPDHVDGHVLLDAFTTPPRATWTASEATHAAPAPLARADSDALRARLESLGYL